MGRSARRSLLDFTRATFPGYQAGWVHEAICVELDTFLEQVIAKESPRLMIFVPPRHGKTELSSRRFPAYALGRHPDLSVIAASYGADLAARINRDVQRVIDADSYRSIFPNTQLNGSNIRSSATGTSWLRNSDMFEVVDHKGVYRSTGVGGGITGMGADILLIDDPVKDMEQAHSATYRQNVWDWYTGVAYTRLMPGGGVVVILTRWHEDDLAGRLLQAMKAGDGDAWRVVSFPAVAEQDEKHRSEGEALHPERYSLDQLQRIKTAVGGRVWASLYQQRPAAAEGSIFKREWWQWYRERPALHGIIQSWDTAFKTSESSDYSVCTTWGVGEHGYYLLDRWRGKVEFPELKRTVEAHGAKWQPFALLIEDKASGQSLIQELKRDSRFPVLPIQVDKDKELRANLVTPLIEAGRVFLPADEPWAQDYVDAMATFPNAAHDDEVDSTTQALTYFIGTGGAIGEVGYGEDRATANMSW